MDSALLKKEFCDDKMYLLSIIKTRSVELLQSERNLKDFIEKISKKMKECKLSEYESLVLVAELHMSIHNFSTLVHADIVKSLDRIKLFTERKARATKNNEQLESLANYYISNMNEIIKTRCNELWNLAIIAKEQIIIINKIVEAGKSCMKIEDIVNLFENFYEFKQVFKEFTKKLKRLFATTSEYNVCIEITETCCKICLKKATGSNLTEDFSIFLSFLLSLFGNSAYAKKRLKFIPVAHSRSSLNGITSIIPLDEASEAINIVGSEIKPNETSEENNILEEVRSLVLCNDYKIIEVSEDTEKNSLTQINNLIPSKCNYYLATIKIPETTSKLIEILYRIIETSSWNENKVYIFKSCVKEFIRLKEYHISSSSLLPNSICLFFNSCKYISYHLIVITSKVKLELTELPINWSLNSLIFQINKCASESFTKMFRVLQQDICEKLELTSENANGIDENANKALFIAENSFILFRDMLSTMDSYTFISKLIDYMIILILRLIHTEKIDPSSLKSIISKISDFSRYFNGLDPCKFSKQWTNLIAINTTS